MQNKQRITFLKAAVIFLTATAYFLFLLLTLLPFLKSNFLCHPALYWFITGYFLFVPLFLYAMIMARREGNQGMRELLQALNINRLSYKDACYMIIGIISIFLITGIIFGCSFLLNRYFGIRLLNTTPWFMQEMRPFQSAEKLLLLVWFHMFFFNIVGEEILWRGYIQNRMEGNHAWLQCAFLWMIFHIPFGLDMIIFASPALVIIPYIFHKRNNTLITILIHGIYNGPIFILVALGIMK